MIYRDVFLLVFIIPCILSILLAYLSGKSERILGRILCFSGGVSVFWIGLVLASDLGFRMLQSDPDATDAAFNDTAPVGTTLRLATCIHLLQHYLLHDVDTEADQKVKGIGLNRSTIKQHHPSMPPENLIEIIQRRSKTFSAHRVLATAGTISIVSVAQRCPSMRKKEEIHAWWNCSPSS